MRAPAFSLRIFLLVLIAVTGSAFAQNADMQIAKLEAIDPVIAGQNQAYTIIIANSGPDASTGIIVTDILPANTTFIAASGAGFTCGEAAGTVTCTHAGLANATGASFTLTIGVDADYPLATLENTASVTANEADPVPANNSATETSNVTTSADLGVVKIDAPDPVAADGVITYTVTVTNNGPSDATNVVLTDTVPAGGTVGAGTTPAGFVCAPLDAVTIQCTGATLASGASAEFTFPFDLDPATTGPLTNSVVVSSDTSDPNAANNNADATTAVTLSADLQVVKIDAPDPVLADGVITYTVTVTNNGPSDATNVVLTDTVPAGGTVGAGTTPAGFTCAPLDAVTIQCTGATLASGASAEFTFPFDLDPGTTGPLTNSVTVSSDTSDPNAANNSADATTAVTPSADLQVVKIDAPDPVLADGVITYTVTVTNLGPSAATNVVLTDTVPAGGTVGAGTTPAGFTCAPLDAVTIQCTGATLASGASAEFTFPFDLDPGTTGPLTNSVTVSSDTSDPNAANNSADATTAVTPSADLSVTKTDSPDPVLAGANITYTITVANAGPSTATAIALNDNVPAETTFTSLTAPGGFTCSTPAVGGTGAISCTGGTIASGANGVFTLVVAVDNPATGPISNTATVSSSVSDPAAGNNSATATTAIAAPANADVSILKTAGAGPFVPGDNIPYTITVTNNGPGSATNVTVVDTLPAGTTFVSATPSAGSCSGTGPVNCTLGTLTNGANATITLIVTTPATAGTFVNNVTVSATETDPTPANNAASASATTGDPAAIPFTSPWVLLLLAATLAVVGATRFRI